MGNHIKERKTFLKSCEECGEPFETKGWQAKYCSKLCRGRFQNKKRPLIERQCPVCETSFKSIQLNQITCSLKCQGIRYSDNMSEKRTDEFKNTKVSSNNRRRKKLRKQWVEDVDLNVLIEKYNGICQLCDEPIKKDVHTNHNLYPSRDHIVPINLGGEHSYKNTQLAHRICNSRKGDRINADRTSETICQ